MKNDNLLENEIISQLNNLTGLYYTTYHHRNVGYLYIIISFLMISIVITTNSIILLSVGLLLSYLLYSDGKVFANIDLEYMYMLHLPTEKKKSALLLDIITQFFHKESLYVEFESVEDSDIILKATFYDYNGNSNIINYHKNYNVTKGKRYKIADLIK